jgi:hypothetical protein
LAIFALTARAEKISLVNGPLINPGTSQPVQNATIVIDGGASHAKSRANAVAAVIQAISTYDS